MLSDHEMAKITEKSRWDEGKSEWKVPYFIVKDKEMALPTINAQARVKDAKDGRDIIIQENSLTAKKRGTDSLETGDDLTGESKEDDALYGSDENEGLLGHLPQPPSSPAKINNFKSKKASAQLGVKERDASPLDMTMERRNKYLNNNKQDP